MEEVVNRGAPLESILVDRSIFGVFAPQKLANALKPRNSV